MNPRPLLQLEGTAVLTVSLLSYHWSQGSWLQFALLFLLPDLSMLGYAANSRVGAIAYNAVHTYVGPLVLAGYSFASNRPAIVSLSLIWIAHIGLDRMLGLSIPYTMVWRRVKSRRERRFANSMKADGRIIDWEHFIPEINAGHGTLIVERFSFKGPIRMWWTREDVYEACPYPLVDWLTMARETSFDVVRDWCHGKYTSNTGSALLVDGSKEQWRTIRGNSPLSFRDGILLGSSPAAKIVLTVVTSPFNS